MGEEEQQEQGPSGLRAHVKDLEKELRELRNARETEMSELQQFRREKAFQAALSEAKVEGVSLADVGDLPPDQITPTLVKAKAGEKEEQRRAALADQAKAAGFDSVESFETALKAFQDQQTKAQQEQATAAQVAMSSAGQPPARKTPADIAFEAHQAARERGVPADYAQAEFVGAKARAFMEQTGASVPAGGPT